MVEPSKVQLARIGETLVKRFKEFLAILFAILVISVLFQLLNFSAERAVKYDKVQLGNVLKAPEHILRKSDPLARATNRKCSHWDCFDIYKCGRTGHDRITVYVYPLRRFLDENGLEATETMSKQYYAILRAIIDSNYYTANPNEACLFVPPVDTLSQDRINLNLTSKALNSLPKYGGFWFSFV